MIDDAVGWTGTGDCPCPEAPGPGTRKKKRGLFDNQDVGPSLEAEQDTHRQTLFVMAGAVTLRVSGDTRSEGRSRGRATLSSEALLELLDFALTQSLAKYSTPRLSQRPPK